MKRTLLLPLLLLLAASACTTMQPAAIGSMTIWKHPITGCHYLVVSIYTPAVEVYDVDGERICTDSAGRPIKPGTRMLGTMPVNNKQQQQEKRT